MARRGHKKIAKDAGTVCTLTKIPQRGGTPLPPPLSSSLTPSFFFDYEHKPARPVYPSFAALGEYSLLFATLEPFLIVVLVLFHTTAALFSCSYNGPRTFILRAKALFLAHTQKKNCGISLYTRSRNIASFHVSTAILASFRNPSFDHKMLCFSRKFCRSAKQGCLSTAH